MSSIEQSSSIQLGFWESLFDLFKVHPLNIIGLILILFLCFGLTGAESVKKKLKVTIPSLLLFYFLLLSFSNIFGIPTATELNRMTRLGEGLFHAKLELMPLADGLSPSFILNILVFIPIGFLVPCISKFYQKTSIILLTGLLFSSIIEISQLVTLYRATDINDLFANTLGMFLGYLCFKFFKKIVSKNNTSLPLQDEHIKYLPIIIYFIAFVSVFLVH